MVSHKKTVEVLEYDLQKAYRGWSNTIREFQFHNRVSLVWDLILLTLIFALLMWVGVLL